MWCADLLIAINRELAVVAKLDATNKQKGTSGFSGLFLHFHLSVNVCTNVCVRVPPVAPRPVPSLRHLSGRATASATDLY